MTVEQNREKFMSKGNRSYLTTLLSDIDDEIKQVSVEKSQKN